MKTYKQMTSLFHRAVRKELLDGLFLCTADERYKFKLLYAKGTMTTAEVVGKLSLHSLSRAMEQVQCTLDKKKRKDTKMIRYTDKMTEKARQHVVYAAVGGQRFVVESGSSGKLYRVSTHDNDVSYWCTCDWAEYYPGSECSHVLAVRMRERVSVLPTG